MTGEGEEMHKFWLIAAVAFATATTACDMAVDGPVPVRVDGAVVMYSEETCSSDDDCQSTELCSVDLAASLSVGHTVSVCVAACYANWVSSQDGTVTKLAGSDTCQRFGEKKLFCAPESAGEQAFTCLEQVDEEAVPSPPSDGGEGEADVATIQCCYAGQLTGLFGQFSWSESTLSDPEAWNSVRDQSIGPDGCFSTTVDLAVVAEGFWADLTVGPAQGKPAQEVVWKGATMRPTKCFVDGLEVPIGDFQPNLGWPF